MTISAVDICNLALSNVGTRSTIAALNEGSTESVQCQLFYDITRKEMLRAAHWNFARREVTLGVLAAAEGTEENPDGEGDIPPTPWAYMYAYPSDCLKARHIKPERPRVPFLLSGALDASNNPIRVILTDAQQAELVYTADIEVPDVFDPEFVTAFALALASKLAIPLTGDKALAQGLIQQAMDKIKGARATDGNEQVTVHDPLPDWLAARGVAEDAIEDAPITYEGQ